MIERVYLKEYVTFDKVELEFSKGLIVFTGPSGSGKSILIKGILSIFGFSDLNAKLGEAIIDNQIDLQNYGLENDDILIFKQVKKNKNRFFINNQAVSKKIVKEISNKFIRYLSVREIKEFQSKNILKILDKMSNNLKVKEYEKKYKIYHSLQNELLKIDKLEKEAKEKREFLKFELEKIEKISPKEGEFEELIEIKKDLSKIEKIKDKLFEVERIFNFENSVIEFLDMINYDNSFFSDAMNELRFAIQEAKEKAEFLENVDIEEVLNRLSTLQELIRRYGSIKEAINYYEEKQKELKELENISFKK